jgi:hypothetical protein
MNNEETITLFEHLLKSLQTRGFKKTLKLIYVENEKSLDIENEHHKHIILSICKLFQVTYEQIKYGRYDRGENKYVIGFIVFYLYPYISLNEMHKKYFIGRNKTLLSRYRQLIIDLNPKSQYDKFYLDKKEEIEKELGKFELLEIGSISNSPVSTTSSSL